MTNRTSEAERLEAAVRSWLELQVPAIAGVLAARAVLGPSDELPGVCAVHWPAHEPLRPRLAQTVDFARESAKVCAQRAGEHSPTELGSADLAVPVTLRERVIGALGVTVTGWRWEDMKLLAERLRGASQTLAWTIELLSSRERLAARLTWTGVLLEPGPLDSAARALCAELARSLGCQRTSLAFSARGRLQLTALSSSARFDPQSELAQRLRTAMEEAVAQDAPLEHPPLPSAAPRVTRAQAELARGGGAAAVRTLPLAAKGHCAGALSCEWSLPNVLDGSIRARMDDAALIVGPLLELLARAHAGPLTRARERAAELAARALGVHPRMAAGLAAAGLALLLCLGLLPVSYRVTARATLEGRVQRALVAAADGYIEESNARAGDLVRAGDVLARLDDRDLRLERRKWQGQLARLEKEQREALAQQERTRIAILDAQLEQALAELARVEDQLGRTAVVAPFAGVVLQGDLSQALGSPVDRGTVLFQLAPLDGYRIILQVDERDIADVAPAQLGRLALSAFPDAPLPLRVERITPMSTPADGRNYFRVEAELQQPSRALRPGLEGIAKVEVGRRRLLWIWTHTLFDWLRLALWAWLP